MFHTTYHRLRTLEEALSLKAETPGACYIAGGTDLLVQMKSDRERPGALIKCLPRHGEPGEDDLTGSSTSQLLDEP